MTAAASGGRLRIRARGSSPTVFAVEPDAVQVTWRRGPDGQPGTQSFAGLAPATVHQLPVAATGTSVAVTTPPLPPGAELCRVATINDLHIGSSRFGYFGTLREPPADVPHAVRCLRSTVRDALAWGARLLIVKGDLTHSGHHDEWEAVGDVLAGLPVPVAVVPGNHDVKPQRTVEAQPALARYGLHLVHGVEAVDLPGARVLLVDSTIPDRDRGRIAHLQDQVVALASRASTPVVVAMHHQVDPFVVPTYLPVGIPAREGHRFLDALATANPRTLVATGHTHRHRVHRRGPLTMVEVGSTKDFPGTWAGYVVHEDGVRQVVRRVSDPTCLPFLDRTAHAVLGLWGHWSPGRLADRCFTVAWDDDVRGHPRSG